jgi:hypothetical protein
MQAEGFYLDTGGKFDQRTDNTGATYRWTATSTSKINEFYGRIHADVFNMQKLLLNDVDMKITFDLEKRDFYLMKTHTTVPETELKIIEASVFVRYLTISPSMLVAQHKMLQTNNASYDFKRTIIKNFSIPSGVNTFNIENMFSGQLPTNMLLMFLDNDAFAGSLSKNPFNFQHFNINQIQLNVNGNYVLNQPITLDPESGLVAKAYHDLHLGLNYANKDFGLQFDQNDFTKGFTIFAFDLTPTKRQNVVNFSDTGILKGEIKFKTPLTQPVVMLVYAEFNNNFEVTSSKNVIVNY